MRNALPAGLLGGDQRAAAPAEQIQHVLASRDEYCIARTANSTGFSVKWTILLGLTFLTCHRSVALFGP